MSKFWQIFIGQFTSTQLIIYVIIQILVFLTFLGLARFTYPQENNYSIMTHTMSFLGSKEEFRNPKGWYFFSIAIIWITIADIPLNLYIFRYLLTFSLVAAWMMIISAAISTLFGILVSIFTDTDTDRELAGGNFIQDLKSGRLHNVAAVITFATFIVANLIVGFAYVFNPFQRPLYNWVPPFLIFVGVLIGFFLFNWLWQKKCKKNKDLEPFPGKAPLFSFPFWEWLLFISLYIFLFWNVFII
ncbi:MAG: DUF998 domain-containing protein [Candidatus Lokiarchaeota archaeon]|nr:DUF998 domain-containing protein [Candidatus Lokiarchaeota archaeon]